MPEEMVVGQEISLLEIPRSEDANGVRWFELLLVLTVAFGVATASSINMLVRSPAAPPVTLEQTWFLGCIHELASLALLGYVLWRRRRRITDLGLCWSIRDLLTGLYVAGAGYFAYYVSQFLANAVHHAVFGEAARGITFRHMVGHPSLAIAPLILLNPFFEELIVRAYLMTEVKELTGSSTLAVALSTLLQFVYHLYYGWIRAIALGFQFLFLSIYFAKSRKATPLVVAHGIYDILPILRMM